MSITNQHIYLLLNSRFGGPSYNIDFIQEVFEKFPPNTELGKILFPMHTLDSNVRIIIGELFFENNGFQYYRTIYENELFYNYNSSESSDTISDSELEYQKDLYVYIYEKTTNQYYHLDTQNYFWYNNQELIEYILHRKDDQIVSTTNGKFTAEFYQMMKKYLNKYMNMNIKQQIITQNPICTLDFKNARLYYGQDEFYDLTIYNDNYYKKTIYLNNTNNTIIDEQYGIFTFNETNWRTHPVAYDIYSQIYLPDINGHMSKFNICKFHKELTYKKTEYDGKENVDIKLPNDKIITELVQINKGQLNVENSCIFTQLLLSNVTIQEIKDKYEKLI